LKQSAGSQVLVGDEVVLHRLSDGTSTIERVGPRRSVLKRRSPGRTRGVRHIAANVDRVVVVGSARHPMWDASLIDRFTVVAAANGLPVAVVVNKCDLVVEWDVLGRPYEKAGYPVVYTSVPNRQGMEDLRRLLENQASVLSGPTGVGKSSLLNALQPGLRLRTAAVSKRARSGRHTTVSAEMHRFGQGGFVVDSPGLRDIGLWGLEPREVAAAFPEFAQWTADCRFDNCRHLQEPGCAIVEAVTRGDLATSRLESYRQMLSEAQQAARPWARGKTR
jgi:ribosome biogenesis GTPase